MKMRVGTHILIVCSLIMCIAHASSDLDDLFITVDGIDYAVELENSSFAERIKVNTNLENSNSDLELYQGTVPEVPGSWIAVSYSNGEWRGLASVYDRLYELKGAGLSGRALSIVGNNESISMDAGELNLNGELDLMNMCAMPHAMNETTKSALASIVPGAAAQNDAAFAVGGITQAVNIVLALDQFHTASMQTLLNVRCAY